MFSRIDVIYKCDKGYTLVGEAKLSCSSSRWSPAAPQCKGNSSSLFSQAGGSGTKALRVKLLPARGSMETFDLILFDGLEIITVFRMQTLQRDYMNTNLPSLSPSHKTQPYSHFQEIFCRWSICYMACSKIIMEACSGMNVGSHGLIPNIVKWQVLPPRPRADARPAHGEGCTCPSVVGTGRVKGGSGFCMHTGY